MRQVNLFFCLMFLCFCLLCMFFAWGHSDDLSDQKVLGESLAGELLKNEQSLMGSRSSESLGLGPSIAIDEAELRKMVLEGQNPEGDLVEFLSSSDVQANSHDHSGFSEAEDFFQRSEGIIKNPGSEAIYLESVSEGGQDYVVHRCLSPGSAYPLEVVRYLHVDVDHQESKVKKERVCKGHSHKDPYVSGGQEYRKFQAAHSTYSGDPSIASYRVYTVKESKGLFSSQRYVITEWNHKADSPNCDCYTDRTTQSGQSIWREKGEYWSVDSPEDLAKAEGPLCTFVGKKCLDSAPRTIHGKKVLKQCWKEALYFQCQSEQVDECAQIKARNCKLVSSRCLKTVGNVCTVWERTFHCDGPSKRFLREVANSENSIYCIGGDCFDASYEQNQDFLDVATTLSIFEEMQKELETSASGDPRSFLFFGGDLFSCQKSIASDLVFDCCFTHSGLATEVGLAKCSAEENALAERRERGHCHYVGSHKDKVIGVTVKTNNTFCCFPSKLARVFQEEAREQLGLDWGNSENPDCSGLSQELIQKLDFSKIDLREAFQDLLEQTSEEKSKAKVDGFELRLEEVADRMKKRGLA